MNDNKRDDELGALWEKTSENGPYMTGSVQVNGVKVDIVVFPNKYRKAENHPSYRILASRPKEERTSTRRDEAQYQPEQCRNPRPPSRHETLGVRPEDQPGFNPRAAFGKSKKVNGVPNHDWTTDVPEYDSHDIPQQRSPGPKQPVDVTDDDIPF